MFIDLIKGIVLISLSQRITAITHSSQLMGEILHTFLHEIFALSQQLLWLPRCNIMIEKEKSLNIYIRMKKRSSTVSNTFSCSASYNTTVWPLGANKWISPLDIIDKMTCFGLSLPIVSLDKAQCNLRRIWMG